MPVTGDTVERLNALVADGFEVQEVTSDDEAVEIELSRGATQRTVRLGRRQARRLLTGNSGRHATVHA